jgi:hypothetical protein
VTPEGRVKAAVRKFLKSKGAWFYMRSGIPDFICCWEGKFYAIETKAPGKRSDATPNQLREIDGIKLAGGVALIVDDVSQLARVFTC